MELCDAAHATAKLAAPIARGAIIVSSGRRSGGHARSARLVAQ
jgi:hypothetical protein